MKVSFRSMFIVGGALLSTLLTECHGLFHREKMLQLPTSQRYRPSNFEGDEGACLSTPNPRPEYDVRGGGIIPPRPGTPGYEEKRAEWEKKGASQRKSMNIFNSTLLVFFLTTFGTAAAVGVKWKNERSFILLEIMSWILLGFMWRGSVDKAEKYWVVEMKYTDPPPPGTRGKTWSQVVAIITSIASMIGCGAMLSGETENPDRVATIVILAMARIAFIFMMSDDNLNPFFPKKKSWE